MKYVYILLICLILFYILSRFFEKYYSQENFDPSLVPVSSIITLAKVAQKIVDGNGTLTNPANLNIGTTNAKGNLLVTGDSTTNGNKQVDGTLGVTGATTLSNTLNVTGATTLSGGVTGNTNFAAATIGVSSPIGTPGASSTPAATNLTVNGATKITGATTIGGTLGVTGNTTIGGSLTATGTGGNNITVKANGPNLATLSLNTPGTGYTFYAADPSYTGGGGLSANHLQLFAYGAPNAGAINQIIDMYPGYTGNPNNTVILNADTYVNNKLSASQLCIGGTCLTEIDLKRLKGTEPIALYYNLANDNTRVTSGGRAYIGSEGYHLISTDDAYRIASMFIKGG